MFRAYAHFTVNHPYIHALNLLLVTAIVFISGYQLLANEELVYATGFILVLFPSIVFAKSSDYRRKYISQNN